MYYVLNQCKGLKTSKAHGKWFAKTVSLKTIDLDGLISHMSKHHTGYSEGIIAGVIRDMVACIKELVLQGYNVKLDNLAIFSGSIVNAKGGADKASTFSVAKNVSYVKVKALGTGRMSRKMVDIDSQLKYAPTYATPEQLDAGIKGGVVKPDGGGGTPTGGDTKPGGGGGTTGGDTKPGGGL